MRLRVPIYEDNGLVAAMVILPRAEATNGEHIAVIYSYDTDGSGTFTGGTEEFTVKRRYGDTPFTLLARVMAIYTNRHGQGDPSPERDLTRWGEAAWG